MRYGVRNRLEMYNFKPRSYNITTKFREMWLNMILFRSEQGNNSLCLSLQQLIHPKILWITEFIVGVLLCSKHMDVGLFYSTSHDFNKH